MAAPYRQNLVSLAIWPWSCPREPVRLTHEGQVRRRAMVQASIAFVAGLVLLTVFKRRIIGVAVAAIGLGVLASGLFLPRAFVALERAVQRFAKGVGAVMTWILLVPFFYLCFAPAHALIRLLKKDPLRLKFPSDEPTYWTPRPPVSAERMRSQF